MIVYNNSSNNKKQVLKIPYHKNIKLQNNQKLQKKKFLEVARRLTESVLRDRGFPGRSTLNFEDIVKKVEMQCPTLFKLLSQIIQLSQNYDKKTAPLALIYGIIMFRRCKEMSRIQRVNTVLLNDGGASQEVCLLKLNCGIII